MHIVKQFTLAVSFLAIIVVFQNCGPSNNHIADHAPETSLDSNSDHH